MVHDGVLRPLKVAAAAGEQLHVLGCRIPGLRCSWSLQYPEAEQQAAPEPGALQRAGEDLADVYLCLSQR